MDFVIQKWIRKTGFSKENAKKALKMEKSKELYPKNRL